MAPPKKSPSDTTGDKPKRVVRPVPAYGVVAEKAFLTIDAPTIDNVRRALSAASGKSARKLVKLDSVITDARMTKEGALQLAVALASGDDGATAVAEAK
jgi:hypothetical protein